MPRTFAFLVVLLGAVISNTAHAILEFQLAERLQFGDGYYPWPDTTPPGTSTGQSFISITADCTVTFSCGNTLTITNNLNPVETSPGVYFTPQINALYFNVAE